MPPLLMHDLYLCECWASSVGARGGRATLERCCLRATSLRRRGHAQCARARANAGIHALCHELPLRTAHLSMSMRMLGVQRRGEVGGGKTGEALPESNFSASAHACAMPPRPCKRRHPRALPRRCLCSLRIPLVHADVGRRASRRGRRRQDRAVAREQLHCVGGGMRNAQRSRAMQTQASTSSATTLPLRTAHPSCPCGCWAPVPRRGRRRQDWKSVAREQPLCVGGGMRNAQCSRAMRPRTPKRRHPRALPRRCLCEPRIPLVHAGVGRRASRRGRRRQDRAFARERSPESARPRMSPRKRRHPRALPRRCLCELRIPLVYAGVAKRTKKRHIRGESFRTSSPTIPCPSHLRTRPHRPVLRSRTHTQDNPRNPIHICASV